MNRSFKSIFNRRTGVWQVASENTRHAGKTGNSVRKSVALLVLGMSVGASAMAQIVTIDGGQTVSVPSVGQPSPWDTGLLHVGVTGTGTLNIESGGVVASSGAFIGFEAGSNGTVTVTGADSTWNNTGDLWMGYLNDSTGTLAISDGGTVTTAFDGSIGNLGNAEVTVTGTDSTLTISRDLWVGRAGTGTLTIADGGIVTSASTTLGSISNAAGTLHLNGNSTDGRGVLQTGQLLKGSGTANVTIDGGVLRATGDQANFISGFANGSITLAGDGLFFDTNGNDVGINVATFTTSMPDTGILTKQGEGTLTLNGNSAGVLRDIMVQEDTLVINGEISNTFTQIDYTGGDSDKTATLIVSGPAAKLDTHALVAGDAGTGSLIIENQAHVIAVSYTTAGDDVGSEGHITVTGGGTILDTGFLYSGYRGKGTIEIKDGAHVLNGNWAHIGYEGTGAITVTGHGSRLENGAGIIVGDHADGTLTIADGGVVTNAVWGYVGHAANATAVATVTGANSLWENGLELFIGFDDTATGTLNIEDGGKVKNTTGYVGYAEDATGTVNVNGINSAWENAGPLYVGLYGSGTLNVSQGGSVSNTYGYVGATIGGVSSATVTGAGSNWTNSLRLYVGDSGIGTLNIEDGGKVSAENVHMAASLSANGTLNLNGTAGARGILATGYFEKGSGTATFNWDGGIVQATSVSAFGDFFHRFSAGDVTIGSNGAFFDTQGFNTAIQTTGVLSGMGGLTKMGSATLSIAGGNTYGGNTTVSAGVLRFDTYDQVAGQTLGIGAVNPSSYGRLDVTGVATFNDRASIDVDVASPLTPALAVGEVLTGVITAGTLHANGFTVTDNSALFNFLAVQNAQSVDLRIVASSATGIREAVIEQAHWSALGAADVLDINLYNGATGDMGTVIAALGLLSNNRDTARAAAQTLPVISGNAAIEGTLSTFQKLVQNRNGGNSGTTGLASGDALLNKNAWGKVFGSRAEQDSRSGAAGFKADTWGLALGADAQVAPGARFGVAYGYAKTSVNGHTDLSGSAQRANIGSHIIAAYGSKDLGDNRTFSFQGDIGVNDNKSTRQIDFMNRTARADYRTYSAHIGAAIAQSFALSEKTTLTPALRADYTWLKSQSYNETGADALNLNVGSNKTDTFVIGADAYLQHRFSNVSRIDANLGLGYDVINEQGNIVAAYAGAPGQSFVTTGIDHSPWLVRGGIGYSMQAMNGTEISFRYDAEGRSDYLNHTASVRAKWAF
ncbi:MAG: autotransporter domain-containing protein [Oxalicibacterium faecigallinarum]|uniref:autotransporter domain-containing protein n=1 Tax=Oxalicibacterium faecigallinarum TaxID=573741 RepID=UPI002808031B|nr:autotransporter domain-containing protein [Oxalicibacterium faecigallinarum]MDQ7969489.1 autotransporter domain-containing protein [Oxalicibacterium faecigallinarum]